MAKVVRSVSSKLANVVRFQSPERSKVVIDLVKVVDMVDLPLSSKFVPLVTNLSEIDIVHTLHKHEG